jgi:hypothetical protein
VAINDFQKAIIPDIGKVKANIVRLEEQLLMNKRFISEVLTVKKEFGKLIFIFPFIVLTLKFRAPQHWRFDRESQQCGYPTDPV